MQPNQRELQPALRSKGKKYTLMSQEETNRMSLRENPMSMHSGTKPFS